MIQPSAATVELEAVHAITARSFIDAYDDERVTLEQQLQRLARYTIVSGLLGSAYTEDGLPVGSQLVFAGGLVQAGESPEYAAQLARSVHTDHEFYDKAWYLIYWDPDDNTPGIVATYEAGSSSVSLDEAAFVAGILATAA